MDTGSSKTFPMTRLEYIYHDGFLLSIGGRANMLFDYWKEGASGLPARYSDQQMPMCLGVLDRELPLYVFISHHHKDHYNPGLFRWIKEFPKGRLVVSKDVARFGRHLISDPELTGRIISLRPGEEWEDDLIKVHAFGSTDIGDSYGVELRETGRRIFHAGDLNDWIWLDESTEQEVRQMEGNFKKVLRDIENWTDSFWIAMFPVDSRIGREYWRGAKIFLSRFHIDRFFPMHFELGETDEERARLKKDARTFGLFASENCKEYIALQSPGDTWACV